MPQTHDAASKRDLQAEISVLPRIEIDSALNAIRCGEHADFSSLTLLIQDGINAGLQVKTKQGTFIHVDPLPGAILVLTLQKTEVAANP